MYSKTAAPRVRKRVDHKNVHSGLVFWSTLDENCFFLSRSIFTREMGVRITFECKILCGSRSGTPGVVDLILSRMIMVQTNYYEHVLYNC